MDHSLRYTVNCSLLFTELALLDRPAAARRAGFGGVEFWWPFGAANPADKDVDAFVGAIENAGVQLTGLNFAAGDMSSGERGLVSLPGRTAEFQDSVDVAVGIGERLGCRGFNALYGNRLAGADAREQDEVGVENLAMAAHAVGRIGGTVLVEAVSGTESYPLRTAADVIAVMSRVRHESGVDAIGFLADLYHLAANGDDIDEVITRHAGEIAHVQVADYPGRGQPGTGQLPIQRQLRRLESAGYRGWVGLEYQPTVASIDSFGWISDGR